MVLPGRLFFWGLVGLTRRLLRNCLLIGYRLPAQGGLIEVDHL